jgi:radical SAM superfamily enzyme YgiQ (UPF0313 family)
MSGNQRLSALYAPRDQTLSSEEVKANIARVIRPNPELDQLPPRLGEPKKVLLIVPPGTLGEAYGRLSGAAGELPMLGLAYIAAALRDQGHEVRIIDYEVNDWPMDRVGPDIASFGPEVVGMTAYITNMQRCAAVARIAKQVDPRITVILGGPQVSIFPEEGFASPHVDMVVLSEGEVVIRHVMNALGCEEKLRAVKGVWFRSASAPEKIHQNEREDLVADLDILPPPALDLFDMDKYFPPAHIRGRKVAHLLTSRGCPFKCTFCETKLTFGRSFRYHSTERVLSELELLIARGYDSFQFYDDIFTINKLRVKELCQMIIDAGWKISWMCFTRTNCVSPDMLELMKKSGCYLVTFGAESGDNTLLKLLEKQLTVEKNLEGIQMTRARRIRTLSSFMLGLPTETPQQTEKTVQFALESGLDYAVFPITEPYPGTELWVDAEKFGKFDTSGRYRNNLLSENSAVWVPNDRTREEIERAAHKAMRRFYLRPRQMLMALENFWHLPLRRASRYLWTGIKFFTVEVFKKSRGGARY